MKKRNASLAPPSTPLLNVSKSRGYWSERLECRLPTRTELLVFKSRAREFHS